MAMKLEFFKDLGDSETATPLDKEVSKFVQNLLHAKEEMHKLRHELNHDGMDARV